MCNLIFLEAVERTCERRKEVLVSLLLSHDRGQVRSLNSLLFQLSQNFLFSS